MTVLRLSKVSYAYDDDSNALDEIDLSVAGGECVAVIGPNGAGKSTLLRVMAGLLAPTAGTVEMMGKKLDRKKTAAGGNIGILFQDPDDQLFMPSVREDVAFGPLNQGLGTEEAGKRVTEALRLVGLPNFGERVPHHLSYGEKKRVAIAGILAMRPKILLLDEPTANLDPRGRAELMGLIGKLGCTVVMATHDMETAAAMADRVCVLNRKVLATGEKREILTNRKLLESNGLEMPTVARLFAEMDADGEMPLTVGEAAGWMAKRNEGLDRKEK
ncbi:MAG: energy-coupling factor ABC transporter ATP-binding protein [Candidatus Thermoplasmatota archaeon]|nr:ABC transporter ATP-binding protein [Euryarchaeota archaeon]MBU4032724.1 energy-coupling factor ABC transporter ATP-binding protein [Candidatus Thermoplasmatota archaeon]MBU4071305.1 energy-coupling factor ABC transporter ATP-binding protein [Candidatus Thermoplasmatota archaeon]MBU4143400.1 energy-coupling factor ABC transporter ATP-binding protein [Candidatus Thermoplasmatota archaeon]MBU4592209.1 energy-coupling factor ABC transporter ATP-binding protein [Candidatus Thermoplasmatota archa